MTARAEPPPVRKTARFATRRGGSKGPARFTVPFPVPPGQGPEKPPRPRPGPAPRQPCPSPPRRGRANAGQCPPPAQGLAVAGPALPPAGPPGMEDGRRAGAAPRSLPGLPVAKMAAGRFSRQPRRASTADVRAEPPRAGVRTPGGLAPFLPWLPQPAPVPRTVSPPGAEATGDPS